jgi:hypothetical protein
MAWGGNPNSRRQLLIAPPAVLLNSSGSSEASVPELSPFRVMVPDSRLRTKVAIIFSPTPPYPDPFDITGLGATLHLYDSEQDYGGASAALLPAVDLVGTTAAPVAIPRSAGLLAWSKEFVTAGDAITGNLQLANITGFVGRVVIQARWQPDGQRIPDDEWSEIERLCSLVVSQASA